MALLHKLHQRNIKYLLLMSTLLPTCLWANETLWVGSIGKHPIMACLSDTHADVADTANDNKAASRYLYLQHGKPIALHRTPAQPHTWLEGTSLSPTGIWTVDVTPDHIAGEWQRQKDLGNSLPITLNRFKRLTDHPNGCSLYEDDFAGWRSALGERPQPGSPQKLGTMKFATLQQAEGHVLVPQLEGDMPAIQDINQRLKNKLIEDAAGYYTCPVLGQRYVRGKSKEQPEFYAKTEVTFLNNRWLSLQTNVSGDCGGAHPFSDFTYTTLDMTTGRRVNLWLWLVDSRKASADTTYDDYAFNYTATPKLNAIIVRRALRQRVAGNFGPTDDCTSVIEENNEYDIRLDPKGWVFTPMFPHVSQACTEDVRLSPTELQPFLSPEGKQVIQSMQWSSSPKI